MFGPASSRRGLWSVMNESLIRWHESIWSKGWVWIFGAVVAKFPVFDEGSRL